MRGFSVYNVVALGFLHIRTALAQTAEFDVFSVVPNITIEAGTKFDIRWYPSPAPLDGPITISLIHGNQGSLTAPATVLGTNIQSTPQEGKWTWTVPGPADWTASDYASPTYIFRINLDSDNTKYSLSAQFHISGIVLLNSSGFPVSSSTSSLSSSSPSQTGTATTGSSTGTAASATTSNPSSSSTAGPSPAAGGLSTGAKAGIAVAAVLGVAAIAALLFFFLRRRKAKQSRYETKPDAQIQNRNLEQNEMSLLTGSPVTSATATTGGKVDGWLVDFAADMPEKDTIWREGIARNGTHELDASKQSEIPAEMGSPASRSAAKYHTPKTGDITRIPEMSGIGYDARSPAADLADLESDQRLDILQARLEKVRMAKEKLRGLPELEELERDLKDEVMKERRRGASKSNASGTG